jgi:hypothetical protein
MQRFRYLLLAGMLAGVLQSDSALAQLGPADIIKPPTVPPEIEVPSGNLAYLKGSAVGTQNYICLPSGASFAWKFVAPQATLFVNFKWINGEVRQQITTHFLSPNPFEKGTPRATWQSSGDTSSVWAKAIGTVTVPSLVPSIPWLLLEVVGAQAGPTGGDLLAHTTFLQRVNTSGGVMPSTGCTQSTEVGSTAFVPYTADYFFYKANRRN